MGKFFADLAFLCWGEKKNWVSGGNADEREKAGRGIIPAGPMSRGGFRGDLVSPGPRNGGKRVKKDPGGIAGGGMREEMGKLGFFFIF